MNAFTQLLNYYYKCINTSTVLSEVRNSNVGHVLCALDTNSMKIIEVITLVYGVNAPLHVSVNPS